MSSRPAKCAPSSCCSAPTLRQSFCAHEIASSRDHDAVASPDSARAGTGRPGSATSRLAQLGGLVALVLPAVTPMPVTSRVDAFSGVLVAKSSEHAASGKHGPRRGKPRCLPPARPRRSSYGRGAMSMGAWASAACSGFLRARAGSPRAVRCGWGRLAVAVRCCARFPAREQSGRHRVRARRVDRAC